MHRPKEQLKRPLLKRAAAAITRLRNVFKPLIFAALTACVAPACTEIIEPEATARAGTDNPRDIATIALALQKIKDQISSILDEINSTSQTPWVWVDNLLHEESFRIQDLIQQKIFFLIFKHIYDTSDTCSIQAPGSEYKCYVTESNNNQEVTFGCRDGSENQSIITQKGDEDGEPICYYLEINSSSIVTAAPEISDTEGDICREPSRSTLKNIYEACQDLPKAKILFAIKNIKSTMIDVAGRVGPLRESASHSIEEGIDLIWDTDPNTGQYQLVVHNIALGIKYTFRRIEKTATTMKYVLIEEAAYRGTSKQRFYHISVEGNSDTVNEMPVNFSPSSLSILVQDENGYSIHIPSSTLSDLAVSDLFYWISRL